MDITTHNGIVTIHNPATGNHRTFRISTVKNGSLEGRRVVSLLTGSNNEDDYTGFGFVNADGTISVWKRFREDSLYRTYANMLVNPARWSAKGAVYMFEGRCRRCNRTLTDPESIQLGIGPVCRKAA